jgi:hypothetical protein
MRRLRVRCEGCGEVTLPASEIVVSSTDNPGRVNCSYRCPRCGTPGEREFDASAGKLLLMGGARAEPAAPPVAPPLGLADLALLRELLDRPDFVDILGRRD